jgi:hypothetical protein
MQDYPVPIDANALAATIEVNPGWTTITYPDFRYWSTRQEKNATNLPVND